MEGRPEFKTDVDWPHVQEGRLAFQRCPGDAISVQGYSGLRKPILKGWHRHLAGGRLDSGFRRNDRSRYTS